MIPRHIRKQYGLREGTRVEWLPLSSDSLLVRTPAARRKRTRNLNQLRQKLAPYVTGARAVADLRAIREETMNNLSAEFKKTLRKRGINPNKLTEKQVAQLLNL